MSREPDTGVRRYALLSGDRVWVDASRAPEVIREAEGYILPHVEPCAQMAQHGDWRIELRTAAVAARKGVVYRPENQAISYSAAYYEEEDRFWLVDEESGIAQRWWPGARQVAICAPDRANPYAAAQSLYASIRLIGCFELSRRWPTWLLHSAAVEWHGAGILITGAKGSGKTTLAAALVETGCRFVASDRALVWQSAAGSELTGWMCSFRLAPESLGACTTPAQQHRAEAYMAERAGQSEYRYAGKFRFSPGEWIRLCGWQAAPRSRPAVLIELCPECQDVGLEHLGVDTTREALRRHTVQYVLPPALERIASLRTECPSLPGFQGFRFRGRAAPAEMARETLSSVREMTGAKA